MSAIALQYLIGIVLMVMFAFISAMFPEQTGLFFILYFAVFMGILFLVTGRQARGILRDIDYVSKGALVYEAPRDEVLKLRERDFQYTRPELSAQMKYAMLPFLSIVLFLVIYSVPQTRELFMGIGSSLTRDERLASFFSFLALYGFFYAASTLIGLYARRVQARVGTLSIATTYRITSAGLIVDERLPVKFPIEGRVVVNTRRKFVEIEMEQSVMGSKVKQRLRLYHPEPSKLAALLKTRGGTAEGTAGAASP
ncbi:MAG: DUF2208 family protein [Thermofilum sp.]